MADFAAIAGGLGQAATGFTTGVREKRRQDREDTIQDEQRARIKTTFDQQQQDKAGETAAAVAQADSVERPDFNPFTGPKGLVAWRRSLETPPPAAQPGAAPAAPGMAANPNPKAGPALMPGSGQPPAAGLASPDFAAKLGVTPAPAMPAPGSGASAGSPAPAKPADEEMTEEEKSLQSRYQKLENEFREAKPKLYAYAAKAYPNDPGAGERLWAAYFKGRKGDLDAVEKDYIGYKDKVAGAYTAQRANAFVDAVRKNDIPTLEGMFGKGAKPGRDPRTSLDGVIIPTPDGKGQFIGGDAVLAQAMLRAGLMKPAEFQKAAADSANNIAKIIAERDKNAAELKMKLAEHGPGANKDIEVANAAAESYLRLHPGDKEGAEKARLDLLTNKTTRVNAYADHIQGILSGVKDKQMQAELKTSWDKAVKWNKDANDGAGALVPLISPDKALDRFKQLRDKDPQAAITYASNLAPEQTGKIQEWVDRQAQAQQGLSRDNREGTPAPAAQVKKALNLPGSKANQERKQATEALQAHPEIADLIKAEYKKRTGQDY